MASNPQIPSESPANQVLIAPDSSGNVQSAPKSMKGKYDGRKKNGRRPVKQNAPRKPKWLTHLGTSTFQRLIADYDSIAAWPQIYAHAWEKKQLAILLQMREYADSRLLGRPFVAENPNAKPAMNVLNQDNRLQIAIQQLVPAKQGKKKKTKGVIEASSDAKLLTEANSDVSNVVEGVAQVVDSTQDGVK